MTEVPPVPEPDPVPPGLDELITWLQERTPSIMQAKLAQQAITRIEKEARDPALRYAWDHKRDGATMKDLQRATGVTRARIVWAIGKHPRSDV